jgi:hypothetical protein
MGLRLSIITPTLVGVRITNIAAPWIGKKRRRACALVSAYQIVVGQPMFGLTSLARHGEDELERKKIDKGSTYSRGECKWRMQCRGQTLEIRTTTRYCLRNDERNDSFGIHECRGDVALLHRTSFGRPSLVHH